MPGPDTEELMGMMGYYNGDWSVAEWLAMTSMMVVFWVAVIALVITAVRSFRREDQQAGSQGADPDEVLAERSARGEVDADEFQHGRELLHSTRGVTR